MQTRLQTSRPGACTLQRSTQLIAAQPIAFAPLPKAGVRSRQLTVKTHATATLEGKPRLDVDEDKEARLEQFRVVRLVGQGIAWRRLNAPCTPTTPGVRL